MSCCSGTVSWEHVYPESGYGKGACGDCDAEEYQFAWPSPLGCAPCGKSIGCNGGEVFYGPACNTAATASRCDTGPACELKRMADFTPALFMVWAPLSKGLIENMHAGGCC
jgi:hypothetical protein